MKNIPMISAAAEITVSENELAVTVGSGSLKVFSTPSMIALMEKAACACLAEYMEDDETTVGTEMNVSHISATPAGMKVTAEAFLTEIHDDREFVFKVRAYDEICLIGEGTHKRFLVRGEKFTQKTYSKIR